MIPFLVAADLVVKNPCANIDPNSWAWILSGCWIFSSQALMFGASAAGAMLIAYGYQWLLGRTAA